MDDEAVAFVRPRDEIIRVGIIDHLPQLAQEGRHVGGQLRQHDLHDRQHLAAAAAAVVFGFARYFAIQHQFGLRSEQKSAFWESKVR